MFGLNGISTLEAAHSPIEKSIQRLKVKVNISQGEIAMPTISADTYRLPIQVPGSWLIPSAPRMSMSAIDVTWSLNSDVMAPIRTPPRPSKGLISTGPANSFQQTVIARSRIKPWHQPRRRLQTRRAHGWNSRWPHRHRARRHPQRFSDLAVTPSELPSQYVTWGLS